MTTSGLQMWHDAVQGCLDRLVNKRLAFAADSQARPNEFDAIVQDAWRGLLADLKNSKLPTHGCTLEEFTAKVIEANGALADMFEH